jgi:hypothetical protein
MAAFASLYGLDNHKITDSPSQTVGNSIAADMQVECCYLKYDWDAVAFSVRKHVWKGCSYVELACICSKESMDTALVVLG